MFSLLQTTLRTNINEGLTSELSVRDGPRIEAVTL
jgi:hypothetical protein